MAKALGRRSDPGRRAMEVNDKDSFDGVHEIDSGPIRRRIDSITVKMEPFSSGLTDTEAGHARNAIESILQNYFFEVQPWAITTENGGSNDQQSDDDFGKAYTTSITNRNRSGVDGSVTYLGLAKILENKQTQRGVELTMNGLVYFAEGSTNIPDETELLEAMEHDALGDSAIVVKALKNYFPSIQLVTVGDHRASTTPPTVAPFPSNLPIDSITVNPLPSQKETSQAENQVIAITGEDSSDSSLNPAAIAGGIGSVVAIIVVMVGLFAFQRRKRRCNEEKRKSSGDDYLVEVENVGSGFSDDWKVNSNTTADTSFQDDDKIVSLSPVSSWCDENEKENKPLSYPLEAAEEPMSDEAKFSSNTLAYISSLFQRNANAFVEQHQEVSSVSSFERANDHMEANILNAIVDDFDGDGTVTDFEDTVSIQPHLVGIHSIESFEEQHQGMTRQDCVVQKDQLESLFERKINPPSPKLMMSNMATGASTGSNLSYSSSSVSSREQHNLYNMNRNEGSRGLESYPEGDVQRYQHIDRVANQHEDQRVRYSMMPNPYIRRSYSAAAKEDRSAHCVLAATDVSAATLAQRIRPGSDAGSSSGLGMIPKLSAPSWLSASVNNGTNRGPNRRKTSGKQKDRSSSCSAAAAAATGSFEDEDLAYSGDEENTFGVAESDGWDPADTELSSMGDPPTQEDINMVLFHPKVRTGTLDSSDENETFLRSKLRQVQRKRSPNGCAPISTGFQNRNHYALDGNISDTSSEGNDVRFDPSMEI